MNAPFQPDVTSLDRVAVGTKVSIASVDWVLLEESEACRLRHFGFDEGVTVEPLHLGPFGRDPIAVRVENVTIAVRRREAMAVIVA